MKHFSQEELVEQYFNGVPGGLSRGARRHLEKCDECAMAYKKLASDLAAARHLNVPERDNDYGEEMWRRVAPLLPERPWLGVRAPRVGLWRGLSYAGGLAVLIMGAFYLGRMWEHRQQPHMMAAKTPAPAHLHVVVVVLGDYLDQSERLLVELKHADGENPQLAPLSEEARNLLTANRRFREDADKSGDHELIEALDRLDQLLNQLANEPRGLNADAIARLRQEMNTDGLLFEVRVLRSKNPHRKRAVRVMARG
jgi:hypothetical protein